MRYLPKKMIEASRFHLLFSKYDEKIQRLIIKQLENSILDNPQYTDRANYLWMSSLLACISFTKVLENQGISRNEVVNILRNAVKYDVQEDRKRFNKQCEKGIFIRFIEKYIPKYIKKNIGYGWKIEVPQGSDKECHISVKECLVRKICNKYEVNYLIPIFCYGHDVIFGNMQGVYFLCSDQLYTGGRSCDFTFRVKSERNMIITSSTSTEYDINDSSIKTS